MRHPLAATLVAIVATLSVPALAAPLVYSEDVNGAFGFTAKPLGDLGVGVNTVSGARSVIERFSVSLPESLQLRSVSIAVRDITLQSPGQSFGRIRLEGDAAAEQTFDGNGNYAVFPGLLAGPGTLDVELLGFTYGEGNVGVGYRFTVSFDVDAVNRVPEPATLAMVGIGLAGMGASAAGRRRRDASRCG